MFRRRETLDQVGGARETLESPRSATVVGGGIAGVAAATVLAERGVSVTLVEKGPELGGRASAWHDHLESGQRFEMERGFHAFFRQYYNLRALLRRVDRNLDVLMPMEDYPILGRGGLVETFTGLPKTPPFNVAVLTKRTPHLGLRDLMKVNAKAALAMLSFDGDKTYERFDEMSAREYLDSLNFPAKAREMLFNVFAHSFFNPEEDMSAGELLMMFHFYFMGNPEGLIFDVAKRPFKAAIWDPFRDYLEGLGAELRTSTTATCIRKSTSGWTVDTEHGPIDSDDVVLAVTVPAMQHLVASSPDLAADTRWTQSIESLELTNPFAVLRLWFDRKATPGRAPFAGTTGVGILDNISIYELFEDESRDWAEENGGSVVELHAYAINRDAQEDEVREQLLAGLYELYPEYGSATILEERMLIRCDCPAFAPGSYRSRPGVETPYRGVTIAGDFVRIPIPSALMERAAASGFLAANHLLRDHGVRPEPIESIPRRGLLTRPTLMRQR